MAHSKDQVCQEPSTSISLSDSNKTAGKQIFLCFIRLLSSPLLGLTTEYRATFEGQVARRLVSRFQGVSEVARRLVSRFQGLSQVARRLVSRQDRF